MKLLDWRAFIFVYLFLDSWQSVFWSHCLGKAARLGPTTTYWAPGLRLLWSPWAAACPHWSDGCRLPRAPPLTSALLWLFLSSLFPWLSFLNDSWMQAETLHGCRSCHSLGLITSHQVQPKRLLLFSQIIGHLPPSPVPGHTTDGPEQSLIKTSPTLHTVA